MTVSTAAPGAPAAPETEATQARGARAFPTLDGYRIIAAFAIIATHIGFQTGTAFSFAGGPDAPLYRLLARCDVGVAVFFALSGFLLHRPAVRAHLTGTGAPAIRSYLWRRALRILPAYWVAVVVGMVLIPANRHASASTWLTNLTLTQVYGTGHFAQGMTHTWSLCSEIVYYLMLPALWWLLRPRRATSAAAQLRWELTAAGVLALVSVFWIWLVHGGGVFVHADGQQWFPEHLDWFAAGMALAAISAYLQLPEQDRAGGPRFAALQTLASAPGTCWALAVGLFCIALSPVAGPYDLTYPTSGPMYGKEFLYLAATAFFLLPGFFGDQRQGVIRRALASRPVSRLGLISYGVFLFHRPLLEWLQPNLGINLYTGHFFELALAVVPTTLVVAWLSYRFIEQPAERWRDRGPGRTDPMPDHRS